MTTLGVFQILFFFAVDPGARRSRWARSWRGCSQGERTFLHPVLRPLERLIYRLGGVREDVEQHWTQYAGALLAFSVAKFVFTYLIQRLQGWLPLNPQGFGTAQAAQGATTMTPDLAFNTAVSFVTNTNWQSYVGETTMSYFVQMAALTVQNFTSAAAGIAIAIALVRGFARQETKTHRQLLGRHHARDGLHPAADLARRRAGLRLAGSDPELGSVHAGDDGRRRDPDDRAGPGRLAGGDQAARDQRRRVFQRQLGASVREPDALHDVASGRPDLPDSGRPHLHVRRDGARPAPGLGAALRR